MFFAAVDDPGEVHVALWDDMKEGYRVPTEEELESLESHPLTNRIRIDLVLTAGKTWPSWAPYAQTLLSVISHHRIPGVA